MQSYIILHCGCPIDSFPQSNLERDFSSLRPGSPFLLDISRYHPSGCIQGAREAHLRELINFSKHSAHWEFKKSQRNKAIAPSTAVRKFWFFSNQWPLLFLSWAAFPWASQRNWASWPPVQTEMSVRYWVAMQRPGSKMQQVSELLRPRWQLSASPTAQIHTAAHVQFRKNPPQ